MELTPHALESIGFRQIDEQKPIAATFHGGHAYGVQGVILDEGPVLSLDAQVAGVPYAIAAGTSINALAKALFADDFVENEENWAKEHKCSPPYVLVKLGPSSEHKCTTGYIKEENGKLTSYKCFSAARDEIRELQSKVLPSLVSALTCVFSTGTREVRFRPLTSAVFGRTSSGQVIHDIRIEGRGSAYVSRRLSTEEVRMRAERAIGLAQRFNPKVSRFLHLALEEADLLKQFLYFFLSIEIATHATFQTINHSKCLATMINCEPRVRETSARFFDGQRCKWTALKERFVWCAMCTWSHLTDSDIDQFFRLKKIRDDIAHGSIAVPPGEAVAAVKRLATRLHATESPGP